MLVAYFSRSLLITEWSRIDPKSLLSPAPSITGVVHKKKEGEEFIHDKKLISLPQMPH
jgi:hypothetical protein